MNDNKKIAVNTIVLTIKLVITLICSFVVSRLILQALGADNYGLYNVVGGIVAMLNLVATSMVATSYRYIAVERGKGTAGESQKVYSTLMTIHFSLAVLLVVVGLPLGAFYINHYLNVTSASIADAHFVYIFSLIATFFTVIAVPSNGLLIAEEKFVPMTVIDISRSLLNIVMAVVLLYYLGNRLRLYAVLMAILTIGNRIVYQLYCRYKYPEIVRYKFNKIKNDYKGILAFSGWMLLGSAAVVGRTQGVAMVINLFFRNSINAAFGVATQVGNAAKMFTTTLRQAVTPQIMKNQEGNSIRSLNLVYAISRYTYLIMLVISVPLLLCMDTLLQLWLGQDNIPPMTKMFAIFLIISSMVANLNAGFDASIQASGKVRKNQVGYTIINLSIIPIVYFLYKIGLPPYISVVVGVFLNIVTLVFQAYIMTVLTEFTYSQYLHKTIIPSIVSSVVSFFPLFSLRLVLDDNLFVIFVFIILCVIWTSMVSFLCGMSKQERRGVIEFAKSKFHR